MARTKGPTFQLLKQFVEQTPMEGEFTFTVDAGRGTAILHRLRVELSKARNTLKNKGYTIREFKMIHLKTDTKDGKDHVTIKKTQTFIQSTAEILPSLTLQKQPRGLVADGPKGTDSVVKAGSDVT